MLDSMKKKRGIFPKVLLWTLLGLGTIGLTFFGIVNDQLFGKGGAAADVNRDRVTHAEVSRIVEQRRQSSGGMTTAEESTLRDQVVETLVQRKLIVQAAEDLPLYISPEEVLNQITAYDAFMEDGRFSPTKYREVLRLNRINTRSFEQSLREDAVIQKVNLAFQMALKPLSLAQQRQAELRGLKVNVEFLEVSPETSSGRDFTSEEVATFLEDPARMSQVEDIYHQRRDSRYTQSEQVRARQILIPHTAENTEQLADEVYKLAQSQSFESLVAEYSGDELTKDRGGDLGWVERGVFEAAFDQAVFTTEVGEVTQPVPTSEGYHIVKVEDRKAASTSSLEDVQDEIAKELLREEYAQRLVALLKDSVQSEDWQAVNSLVKDHRLTWQETGFFDLSQPMVPQVGASDTFLRAAFRLDTPGEYAPEPIRVGEKTFVVRLKERRHDPDAADPLEGFAAQFEAFLAQQQAQTALNSWVQSLRSRAKVRVYSTEI